MTKCAATTTKRVRCTRFVQTNSQYCWQHNKTPMQPGPPVSPKPGSSPSTVPVPSPAQASSKKPSVQSIQPSPKAKPKLPWIPKLKNILQSKKQHTKPSSEKNVVSKNYRPIPSPAKPLVPRARKTQGPSSALPHNFQNQLTRSRNDGKTTPQKLYPMVDPKKINSEKLGTDQAISETVGQKSGPDVAQLVSAFVSSNESVQLVVDSCFVAWLALCDHHEQHNGQGKKISLFAAVSFLCVLFWWHVAERTFVCVKNIGFIFTLEICGKTKICKL